MSLDGTTEVGKLTKEYAGFIKEAFSVADNFAIKCKNSNYSFSKINLK
jgi:hypothetical protein